MQKLDTETFDVVIAGAGLAGLSLALQLRQALPNLSICVLEREPFPYPEAAHKVGESTVEIAAYYFADVLGLRPHLQTHQLRKLGLRVFFHNDDNSQIDTRLEFGSNRYFPTGTFQLDRGRFENYLVEECRAYGVSVIDKARVRDIEITAQHDALHTVHASVEKSDRVFSARWVVDAAGNASLLRKKLELGQPRSHEPSSAWFRIGKKINIDDWSEDPSWTALNKGEHSRWFSTNHLMGEGYWVWVIPLASGSTSFGIVADPKFHPLSEYNTIEKAMAWLDRYEPQCGAIVRENASLVQDFLARKHYSHRVSKVFSPQRWALTGDAGLFIDPLYSPGSDFIAIANTYITDLIRRDTSGEPYEQYARVFNELYLSLADNTFTLFEDQYGVIGNRVVMPAKIIWDFALYWGYLAFVFTHHQLCNLTTLVRVRSELMTVSALNREMQTFFRTWHQHGDPQRDRSFIDIQDVPGLLELNRQLRDSLDDDAFVMQLGRNVEFLKSLRSQIMALAEESSDARFSTQRSEQEAVFLGLSAPAL